MRHSTQTTLLVLSTLAVGPIPAQTDSTARSAVGRCGEPFVPLQAAHQGDGLRVTLLLQQVADFQPREARTTLTRPFEIYSNNDLAGVHRAVSMFLISTGLGFAWSLNSAPDMALQVYVRLQSIPRRYSSGQYLHTGARVSGHFVISAQGLTVRREFNSSYGPSDLASSRDTTRFLAPKGAPFHQALLGPEGAAYPFTPTGVYQCLLEATAQLLGVERLHNGLRAAEAQFTLRLRREAMRDGISTDSARARAFRNGSAFEVAPFLAALRLGGNSTPFLDR